MNAFELIGMASSLDLSSLFEEEVCRTYFLPATLNDLICKVGKKIIFIASLDTNVVWLD
jgi:hypothetical protein